MQQITDFFVENAAASSNMVLSCAAPNSSIARAIVRKVSQKSKISERNLLQTTRGSRSMASARQLAMYLVHVGAGFSMSATGDFFCRDRTTVRHACACIEDKRDDSEFDQSVSRMEADIAQMMELANVAE